MQETGSEITFAANAECFAMLPFLRSSGFFFVEMAGSSQDEIVTLANLHQQFDLTIVDHYQRGLDFERPCRAFSHQILAMDDLPNRPHDCDILLDPTLDRRSEDYDGLLPSGTRCLVGPSFALLRPQFAQARKQALSRPRASLERLLVMAGASDPAGLCAWVVNALAASDLAFVVHGVVGPDWQLPPTLGRLRVEVHRQVQNMAELMKDADLAIGASGSANWERCCLGLPALLFALADNQRPGCEALARHGAALDLGDFSRIDQGDFVSVLKQLQENPSVVATMSERAALLCDGKGCARVLEVLREGQPPLL